MYNVYKKKPTYGCLFFYFFISCNLYQSIHYNFMTTNYTTIYQVKLLNTALFDSTELRADIL